MAIGTGIQHAWIFQGNSTDQQGSRDGTDANITYNDASGIIDNGADFGGTSIINFTTTTMGFANAWTVNYWIKVGKFNNPRVIEILGGTFTLFVLIIITFLSGEIVWNERSFKIWLSISWDGMFTE